MSYQVTLKNSPFQFPLEDDETVLTAALKQNLLIPYGCKNGACGSCIAELISGTVSYPSAKTSALDEKNLSQYQNPVLLCQAVASSDLTIQVREVHKQGDIIQKKLPCRAVTLEKLNDDVMLMQLKLPASEQVDYHAGQYLEFILKDGRHRAFSIANAPHNADLLNLHIRRVPDGFFTNMVFDSMKPKAILRVILPLGDFYLREDRTQPVIFMAGGTGLAPLLAMLEHAKHIDFKPDIHVFWGVRSKSDLYLEAPLLQCQSEGFIRYTPVLSEPQTKDNWTGQQGWVHEAVLAEYGNLNDHVIYMSGPPPMINSAQDSFVKAGLAADNLYFDSFEFAEDNS